MTMRRSGRLSTLVLALLVVLLDQFSKTWILTTLPVGVTRRWLPGLVDLQLVFNRGAAFSLFTQAQTLLALISATVAVVLVVWVLGQPRLHPAQRAALGLLLGGTVGNGIDRWRMGAVVDFLRLVPFEFPVFNVADVAINLAVVCFIIDLLSRRQTDAR
jgi:signal peptidase II